MKTTTHPDAETLAAFGLGRLPEAERAALETHIEGCDECGRALERGPVDSLLGLAQRAASIAPAPDSPSSDEVPTALVDHPRYRVISKVGAGGMGVVYRAEHRIMGRMVALKVINSSAVAKPGAIERFRREVRLASRLHHPNIVTAFDADEAGGQHFLVMEFVDGVSLDRLVAKRGPLAVAMACHFARQAALGLQHAAEKGMVHRDVKPQNLMVTRKGVVKILDFGLAVVARGDDARGTSDTAARMTGPDMVLGTPDFLAPEQARSAGEIDGRADVYSLGCTLYYLLTGRPPFTGGNSFEKLLAHVDAPIPSVTAARSEVPASLSNLIQRMMAKAPADRMQTPGEAATALMPFARGGEASPATDVEPVEVASAETAAVAALPTQGTRRRRAKPIPAWWQSRRLLIGAGLAVILFTLAAVIVPKWTGGQKAAGTAGAPSVLLLVPPRELYFPDYEPVRQVLEREGINYRTATAYGSAVSRYKDQHGPPVPINLLLRNVNPDDYAAVVIFGAGVNDYLPGNGCEGEARRIIDAMLARKRPVGALCYGQEVLMRLGYLNGHEAAYNKFVTLNNRVRVLQQGVVIDPPFITGGSDQDAVAFAQALVKLVRK